MGLKINIKIFNIYIMPLAKSDYLKKYVGIVDKQMTSLYKKSPAYLNSYNKVKVMTGVYKLQKKGTRDTTKYLIGKKIHYKKTGTDMKLRNPKQRWER
jgi:hypothetical protein